MQYVRSISGSVSKTWNSINPATLSGAIDVIVVQLEDGSLACSPFHVRFGKFSLLRPYEKRVEFRVNDVKQDFAMKLGEGGEAFFVFETSDRVPEALQTSPPVSPSLGPKRSPGQDSVSTGLQEPAFLDLDAQGRPRRSSSNSKNEPDVPWLAAERRARSFLGDLTPLSRSAESSAAENGAISEWKRPPAAHPPLERSISHDVYSASTNPGKVGLAASGGYAGASLLPSLKPLALGGEIGDMISASRRSGSPPPVPTEEAVNRAVALSKKLSISNIPSRVNESGDLMLDMTGYKTSDQEAIRAEIIARRLLAEELQGNYDIGALIGSDEAGNLWVYSSEEAKEAASRRSALSDLNSNASGPSDAASDPGYHSDDEKSASTEMGDMERGDARLLVEAAAGVMTPPQTPPETAPGAPPPASESKNYAKTLRLTSEQLKSLGLRPGANSMKFSVNKASCTAYMYFWEYSASIVISDIDGTITKSDALGHVLNMIGRDWTHLGVAKLYSDIVANGYKIMYLTSRSVGQADTTRNYLNSVAQDGHRLPKGPVILSPDRTIAALRREVYLRKPEVFKAACLRDIAHLFGAGARPFYAGFGNRLTDALSYRAVDIPSQRIFTINSHAEVSLDLLALTTYKSSYVSMRELVDHFFPPVGLQVARGGEAFTDFNFWRNAVLDMAEFSASETEEADGDDDGDDDGDEHDDDRDGDDDRDDDDDDREEDDEEEDDQEEDDEADEGDDEDEADDGQGSLRSDDEGSEAGDELLSSTPSLTTQ